MLLPRLGALLLAARYAYAFKNTSPFYLLSSDPLPSDAPLRSSQYASSTSVEDQLVETLSSCDKAWYYIYTQDHVTPNDLRTTPYTAKQIQEADKSKVVEIPHVIAAGGLQGHDIERRLVDLCTARGRKRTDDLIPTGDEYQIFVMPHDALPSEPAERSRVVAHTDGLMAKEVMNTLTGKLSAVVIYISTPPALASVTDQDGKVYEMDEPYPEALHTDLRRDTGLHRRQSDDDDMQAGLPLFEKYQFLSPPIFMSLSVSVLLLSILFVGIRAISGLDVSYMAFNKEMGPQAQRPKQQ